jgi:hypothetical protein
MDNTTTAHHHCTYARAASSARPGLFPLLQRMPRCHLPEFAHFLVSIKRSTVDCSTRWNIDVDGAYRVRLFDVELGSRVLGIQIAEMIASWYRQTNRYGDVWCGVF